MNGRQPPKSAERSTGDSPRFRWSIALGLWSIPVLIEINQRYLLHVESGEPIAWWAFVVMALFWYSWALLTPVIFALVRRAPIRPPRRGCNVLIHLAVGSLLAVAYMAILVAALPPQWGVDGEGAGGRRVATGGAEAGDAVEADASEDGASEDRPYAERFVRSLAAGYPTMMLVYGALVAIGMGLDLRQRFRAGQLRAARLEQRLAEAQLAALRMQLQPHFLFNTLHAVSALMEDDVPAARRMIARLSELLRVTLTLSGATGGELEVPLEREIEVLERYLDIERVRLGDRLRVEYAVDDDALPALVPVLLLQPLVENAVRHGIAVVARPGRIRISARIGGELLHLAVEDDGPGLRDRDPDGDSVDPLSTTQGIGLANTRARLEQRYGADARLELVEGEERGVLVRVVLPVSRAGDGDAAEME